MKKVVVIVFVVLLSVVTSAVFADNMSEFDWSEYSYEELLEIQEELNNVVSEKQREWAIENGNRVIDFDVNELTLYTTQSQTISASVTRIVDDAPENTQFVWTSSDDSIARVTATGLVTGVSIGDVDVTCTASDDEYIFKTITVHVVLPVTAISIDEPRSTLLISDKPDEAVTTLSAIIVPENAYCQDVTWTSSNETVATVDENGTVTALTPGTSTITVISSDPFSASYPKRATATVTVLQAVSGIELDQTELTMNKNAYATLKASVFPENASQKTLIWESSDPAIVRVTNGQVTALATGEATITCTASDGSGVNAESKITVIQMVNNIRFNEASANITLNMNEEKVLETIISPEDATNKELVWESTDPSIITVDNNGKITAVGGGSCSVICSAADGSGKQASISVFVPSISLDNDKIVVTEKSGYDLVIPFYGDPTAFSYTPSETAFFSITDTFDKENNTFTLHIDPGKAGTSQVYLKDANDYRSNKTISLTIDHSAAYDSISYPNIAYKDVQRYPDKYEGTNISTYGRVLQKWVNSGIVGLFVGPNWNQFYLVTYKASDIDLNVLENDYITVYGISSGDYTYETTRGSANTVPSIVAEKIFMGVH